MENRPQFSKSSVRFMKNWPAFSVNWRRIMKNRSQFSKNSVRFMENWPAFSMNWRLITENRSQFSESSVRFMENRPAFSENAARFMVSQPSRAGGVETPQSDGTNLPGPPPPGRLNAPTARPVPPCANRRPRGRRAIGHPVIWARSPRDGLFPGVDSCSWHAETLSPSER